jgi:hypothetical protein
VPAAYIFMANRQRESYRRVFRAIRDNLDNNLPESLMIDFEEGSSDMIILTKLNIGAKSGFRDIFLDDIPVKHCLFHLSQAVNRRVTSLGLQNDYAHDADFRKAVRSLSALSFLQSGDVVAAFDILRQNAPPRRMPFPFTTIFGSHFFIFIVNDFS